MLPSFPGERGRPDGALDKVEPAHSELKDSPGSSEIRPEHNFALWFVISAADWTPLRAEAGWLSSAPHEDTATDRDEQKNSSSTSGLYRPLPCSVAGQLESGQGPSPGSKSYAGGKPGPTTA